MTVQLIRKPTLLYGLGVRSPFSTYDLEPKDAPILAQLEQRKLRSRLPFEEAILSRLDFEQRTIDADESFTLSGGLHATVTKKARIDVTLEGSRVEDLDCAAILLDIHEDTDLVLRAEPTNKSVHLIYARVHDGATLRFNDLVISDHNCFRRTRVVLEEQARVFPNHAFFTYGDARIDLKSDVDHYGRESFSDMKVRGVLDGSSQVIMQGDVTIKPSAFDANGYQQEDLILASDKAWARPIPNLEIGNNEVKCSHGATVSSPDEEALFYLQSRGIAEADARTLLLSSFVAPVLDLLPDEDIEAVRQRIRGILDEAR